MSTWVVNPVLKSITDVLSLAGLQFKEYKSGDLLYFSNVIKFILFVFTFLTIFLFFFNLIKLADFFEKEMNLLRSTNNSNLENKHINVFMDTQKMQEIDYEVGEFIENFDSSVTLLDYDDLYYNALENGIKY